MVTVVVLTFCRLHPIEGRASIEGPLPPPQNGLLPGIALIRTISIQMMAAAARENGAKRRGVHMTSATSSQSLFGAVHQLERYR